MDAFDRQREIDNLDQLLEQREHIEALIKDRFTRVVTIMFTDLKGSTRLAESHGDVAIRLLIKRHNEILFPSIEEAGGVLVKTMGDGTLSYFDHAAGAVRAAVRIQRGLQEYNRSRPGGVPLRLRVGINTGSGIVEKNDLFGDAVNVASRFEALAEPGEILISESTFAALEGCGAEFCVRFKMVTPLKEKSGLFKAFKVFWSGEEIAAELARPDPGPAAAAGEPGPGSLERAKGFERAGELVQLHLLCGDLQSAGPLAGPAASLRATLAGETPVATRFFGEEALWYPRTSLTLGRTPEADFPLTNQAISRVPLRVATQEGGAVFSVPSRGTPFKSVELESGGRKTRVAPDRDYPLGAQGRILLSGCFPIEYRTFQGRFVVLRILDPGPDLKRVYPGALLEIWRGFEQESRNLLVVGC